MTISLNNKLYRVESCVKVTVPKGTPFIKTKLRDLGTQELVEKNFKLNQPISDVSLIERKLEYLYMEGKDYLFLDIGNLDQVLIPSTIIGSKVTYLKEGVSQSFLLRRHCLRGRGAPVSGASCRENRAPHRCEECGRRNKAGDIRDRSENRNSPFYRGR